MRLPAAGQWTVGDPEILIVADAGYDAPVHRGNDGSRSCKHHRAVVHPL